MGGQSQNSQLLKMSRSLKIDCSGETAIINDQEQLNNEYVTRRDKDRHRSMQQSKQTAKKSIRKNDYPLSDCKDFISNKIKPLVFFKTKNGSVDDSGCQQRKRGLRADWIFTVIFTTILIYIILSMYNPNVISFNSYIVKNYGRYSIGVFQ